jgi:hypothetical protein
MPIMLRRVWLMSVVCVLSACTGMENPFAEKPFEPTAVPGDFAIVVDENHLSYVNRRHLQQVITAADGQSRITYTSYRDPNGAVTEHFTREKEVRPSQLQAMWDEVCRRKLLDHAAFGVNWLSGADLYQENTTIIQIRANGITSSFRRVNGYPEATRGLMLLVEGVRLPVMEGSNAPVVGGEGMEAGAPARRPAETAPDGS